MKRALQAIGILTLLHSAVVMASAPSPVADPKDCQNSAISLMDLKNVDNAKVTILSDSVASRRTLAEWGFSAFVEIDVNSEKKYILFDTGDKESTVVFNAGAAKEKSPDGKDALRVDFNDPKFLKEKIQIVISHHHSDHTKGLLKLLELYPNSFGKIHVGGQALAPRYKCDNSKKDGYEEVLDPVNKTKVRRCKVEKLDLKTQTNFLVEVNAKYKDKIVEHKCSGPKRIWSDVPGVLMSGSIPRETQENNNAGNDFAIVKDTAQPQNNVYDNVPEENALIIKTKNGLVVMTGCGHAGVINTLMHAVNITGEKVIDTLIGGIHTLAHNAAQILDTAEQLKKFSIKNFLGSHCTGIERIFQLRSILKLAEFNAPVGSVETVFNSSGIANQKDIYIAMPSPNLTSPIPAAK